MPLLILKKPFAECVVEVCRVAWFATGGKVSSSFSTVINFAKRPCPVISFVGYITVECTLIDG